MQKLFTLCFLMLAVVFTLSAQIPTFSPFPVDFEVVAPAGIAGSYTYGAPADFGENLRATVQGDLVWARDNGEYDDDGDGMPDVSYGGDSLACSPVVNDVAGKIAVIRRGACFFSSKIYNAQEAGAIGVIIVNHYDDPDNGPTTLVNMAAGDSLAELVVIPAVFVGRATGESILPRLDAGETVTVSYTVSFTYDPIGPNAFGVPQSDVAPIELAYTIFNPGETRADNISGTAEITSPSGEVTTLTATIDTLGSLQGSSMQFEPFAPTEIGTYSVVFTNDINEDVLMRDFMVTEFTYQLDNGEITPNTNGTIEYSDSVFQVNNLRYDAGVIYTSGPNGGMATHVSWVLGNPDELYVPGDDEANEFQIVVYNMDPNGDGLIDVRQDATDWSGAFPIANKSYFLTADDQPFDFIHVEFDNPVRLKPNTQYAIMVEYKGGVAAASGIPPKYAFGGTEAYPYLLQDAQGMNLEFIGGDIVFADQLLTEGIGGVGGTDYNYFIRLQLDGFVPTATSIVEPLAANKFEIAPNPATDQVNLTFDLENSADVIDVRVIDVTGKVVRSIQYHNVKTQQMEMKVADLSTGTYFFSIVTPEGATTEKVVLIK